MQIYDNYGDSVLEAHGKHVDVEAETTEEEGSPPSSVCACSQSFRRSCLS